jgi:hypothetical protein
MASEPFYPDLDPDPDPGKRISIALNYVGVRASLPVARRQKMTRRMHFASSTTLIASVLLLLIGCATHAQRQFQAMKAGNQEHAAQMKACAAIVYNPPESAPLRPHLPLAISDLTLQQLSDMSYATPAEVQAIFVTHPKLKECRKALLVATAQTEPALVPVIIASYNKNEDDLLAVIQQRMTWGEYASRVRDRTAEAQAALQTEDRRVVSGLQQEHQAEIAQRQRAADALAAWAQTQEMINAANRPVITNCNTFGSTLNCVSR